MKLLPTITGPADLKKLSVEQLPQLAAEVRQAICEQVAKSGGHLAPNLGVVDLTIALHYVFDFGHDRLLWDVGHQCYTHKLLTGRQHLLGKLRQRGHLVVRFRLLLVQLDDAFEFLVRRDLRGVDVRHHPENLVDATSLGDHIG